MIREQDDARQRAFSVWLRTGRLLPARSASGIEFKFNPWHDPENGRFTFAGTGRYYGRGSERSKDQGGQGRAKVEYVYDPTLDPIRSMEEADSWRSAELAKHGHNPEYRLAIEEQYERYKAAFARLSEAQSRPELSVDPSGESLQKRGSLASFERKPLSSSGFGGGGGDFGGGGASGSWVGPNGGFRGGGGDYGGGGASVSWDDPVALPRQSPEGVAVGELSTPQDLASASARPGEKRGHALSGSEEWQRVERNGYLYEIDEQNRTRRISGELTLNPEQVRSQSTQLAAGGEDRRRSDHGGHYIARRFNGPTEAFNHFAQDANFNRSDYRRLEEEWARAKRAGRSVRVKIVPVFRGASKRPSSLNIWFWVDGHPRSQNFPNEPKGTVDAK